MKEVLFILIVVAAILGLAAIRYRRQIVGMIQLYRLMRGQLKPRDNGSEIASHSRTPEAAKLINCAKCGRWISKSDAVKMRGGLVLCSIDCTGRGAASQA